LKIRSHRPDLPERWEPVLTEERLPQVSDWEQPVPLSEQAQEPVMLLEP